VINGKTILAIIPARGGSKGVPRKNIRQIGGKPLIAYTIIAAKASNYVDRVILSSDDIEISEVALQYGCDVPFMRSSILSTDTATSTEVILDALVRCPGYDYLLLLQPTSPLRTTEDIDACIEACLAHNAAACVTVSEVKESPFWMYRLGKDQALTPVFPSLNLDARRQDLEPIYSLNGAIYFAKCDWYVEHKSFLGPSTIAHIMPTTRSIDLDTEEDFSLLKILIGE
jgi:CMP-N,N'-diacetyllegionaminic acid synthase